MGSGNVIDEMPTTTDIKYCLYARKSSEQDERQAMSIDSQISEMKTLAERDGASIACFKQESYSAKESGKRPVFNEMLEEIRSGKYDGILTWAADRLSRNAGDLGSLVDLMDSNKLQRIRTYGQSFSNTPNEKFLLMILCSQAKLENDNRGENVKRGIRAKCEMGWRPCMPPLGYFTRAATGGARDVIIDEERAPYIIKMFEMSANGKSGRHIKQWLIDNNVRTRKDKTIHLSTIYKMLKNTFYYGEFEYPTGSGKCYKGNHPPLIDKKLFDKVRNQLIVPIKPKWGAKEFPFKQFLKCAGCGSSIVGEEKTKKRSNGTVKRFVYYHCSRQVDHTCAEPYVREAVIIEELSKLSDELITDVTELEPGLRNAINKFTLMMKATHKGYDKKNLIAGYVKYVLQEGTVFEKTRLVRNLQVELSLHERKLINVPYMKNSLHRKTTQQV